MRSPLAPRGRLVALVAAVGLLASLTSCGSRTPIEEIIAAEGNRPAAEAAADTAAAATAPAGQAQPSTVTDPGAVAAPAATGLPAPGAAPRTSNAPAATAATQKGGGSTKGAPAAGQAEAQCTGPLSTIRIGQVGSFSGVVGEVVGAARLAMQVWVRHVNNGGGVACHPIELFQTDDAGDPARAAAAVQDLVQNKKVVALVGNMVTLSAAGFSQQVNSLKVPSVGGDLLSAEWFDTPYMFAQGGDIVAQILGGVQIQVDRGYKKFGLFTCVEAKVCSDAYAILDRELHKTGATSVYRTRVTLVATSFSAQCQGAKDAGADNILVSATAAGLSRVTRDCKALGYTPALAGAAVAVAPALTNSAAIRDVTFAIGSPVSPWTEQSTAAQKEYHRAFAQLAPGTEVSAATSVAWVSAELFRKAITNLAGKGSGAITSELVMTGLGTIKKDTLGGLTIPLTIKPGQPRSEPQACFYGMLLTKDGWSAPSGNKYKCYDKTSA